jgi:hypothetical protein
MADETVWVLLKESDDDRVVHAVYSDRAALEARVERIGKANTKYPLEQLSADVWRIGPAEEQGFFGDKPVYLWAVEKPLLVGT